MSTPDGYICLPIGTVLEEGDLYVTGHAFLTECKIAPGESRKVTKAKAVFRKAADRSVVPTQLLSELTKKISYYKEMAKTNHADIRYALERKDMNGHHLPNSDRVKIIKRLLDEQERGLR